MELGFEPKQCNSRSMPFIPLYFGVPHRGLEPMPVWVTLCNPKGQTQNVAIKRRSEKHGAKLSSFKAHGHTDPRQHPHCPRPSPPSYSLTTHHMLSPLDSALSLWILISEGNRSLRASSSRRVPKQQRESLSRVPSAIVTGS